jgi:preprotein translocase subunit SecF
LPFEIIPPGTHIDFIGKRKLCALLSSLVLLISLAAIPIRGIQLGVDFDGGTEMQVRFAEGIAVDEGSIRMALNNLAVVEAPTVVRFGAASMSEFLIKFKGEQVPLAVSDEEAVEVEEELAPAVSDEEAVAEEPGALPDRIAMIEAELREQVGPLTVQRVDFVGPRVGEELRTDGLLSLLWAALVIMFYVGFRFSSRFAPGAVVAVVHDLLVTGGIFVILGFEFDLRVLAAMLAILGYSLNDTIIIYDRIRENLELRTKADLPEVLNLSVNQTLARTVLTSGTTLVALFCLYFLGGEVIRPFALAMLIGVVVGTYSSVYIASPVLLLLEDRGSARAAAAN